MVENRPLILRSNRFLGSALLERELITNEQLEAANEILLSSVQSGDLRGVNLINILLFDLKVLDEDLLMDQILDEVKIGIVDLRNYDLSDFATFNLETDLCLATYTLPFDRVEDIYMVATAYYLSKPVIQFWEEQLPGKVLWYVSSAASISEAIERIDLQAGEKPKGEEAGTSEKTA